MSVPATSRVGLDLHIETPENVVLTYQLAGPAVRVGAYLIDTMVRAAILFVLTIIVSMTQIVLFGASWGFWLVVLFLMEWGYFVVCEGFFRGKTVGKQVFGLRVIQEQGHPLTFWGAMLRNLLRSADGLAFYGPAFLSMLLSRRFQRLGDLAARTVVVQERRISLPREPVILEKIRPLSRDEIGSFIPDEHTLSLIDQFLGRRYVLTHERGHALAAILAGMLAERLHFSGDPLLPQRYPMAFLGRVYVTFVQREEQARPAMGDEEYLGGLASANRIRGLTPPARRAAATGAWQ